MKVTSMLREPRVRGPHVREPGACVAVDRSTVVLSTETKTGRDVHD